MALTISWRTRISSSRWGPRSGFGMRTRTNPSTTGGTSFVKPHDPFARGKIRQALLARACDADGYVGKGKPGDRAAPHPCIDRDIAADAGAARSGAGADPHR